jgi:apolipoprotein D and lipocalin family protein
MKTLLILAVLVVVVFAISRTSAAAAPGAKDARAPLTTQADIDLARYMGRWWVIANIPYWGERGKVETADVYALMPDGRIDNVFVYRKAFDKPVKEMKAVGRVVPGTKNAQWQIAFFGGLLKADYLVLEVAPDYSWALIGHPKRKMGWVFSREQTMDEALYQQLLGKMAGYGYDTSKFLKVPQKKEQIGLPGFQ